MSDFFITLDIYNESGHRELIKISSHGNKRHTTSEPPCQPLKHAHLFKISGCFQKREERKNERKRRKNGRKEEREGREGAREAFDPLHILVRRYKAKV